MTRRGRVRLRQDLTILDVVHRRDELAVEVATPAGRRERIHFGFDDDHALDGQLTTLRRWMHRGTPVTYVVADGAGALIDDRALFDSAFGAPELS